VGRRTSESVVVEMREARRLRFVPIPVELPVEGHSVSFSQLDRPGGSLLSAVLGRVSKMKPSLRLVVVLLPSAAPRWMSRVISRFAIPSRTATMSLPQQRLSLVSSHLASTPAPHDGRRPATSTAATAPQGVEASRQATPETASDPAPNSGLRKARPAAPTVDQYRFFLPFQTSKFLPTSMMFAKRGSC
jgi:hypothetical protein